jgi:hypothetical protein
MGWGGVGETDLQRTIPEARNFRAGCKILRPLQRPAARHPLESSGGALRAALLAGNDGQRKGAARNLSTSSRPPSRDLYAGKLKREAVLIAFLRRMSQQSAFVVMGPGSRPGRRFVYDVLARHKSHRFNFQTVRHARAQLRDLAECFFREVFIYFPPSKQRAQGMPGARDLPICPSGQITCARTKDPGGCNADGSACGLSIFLDETAYLFLEAIKLCSVRHNRESNETIHSNEYPQTKTNPSSRPKLGRGT